MSKFEIDFQELGKTIISDPNKIPLKGNEHRLVRVAFDLFHLKDGNPEDLWQVQSSDDGEFLVRTYALPEDEEKKVASSKWEVKLDKKEENLTVAYRNIPLMKLAAKDFGITTPEETKLFQRMIFNKLATDNEFVGKVVQNLSEEKQSILKEAGFSVVQESADPKLLALESYLETKNNK